MTKQKPAPTAVPIHELIAGRWSPRAYSSEPVSREALHTVIEAARWAPSGYNLQPWRFLVFDRTADEAAFKRAFATLVPFNQQWNAPAPVLIAVMAHTLNAKGEVNRTAQYDASTRFAPSSRCRTRWNRSRSSRLATTATPKSSSRCCASGKRRNARVRQWARSSTRTPGSIRSRSDSRSGSQPAIR